MLWVVHGQGVLRAERWAPGGKVKCISGEGQAMGPGIEGQSVRVRIDNGRVLSGQPVGTNRVEVQL